MMHRPIAAVAILTLALIAPVVTAQAFDSQSLQKSGDAVIEALRRDDLAAVEARFDARMRNLFPYDKLAESWARIRSQAGKLQQCGVPISRPRDVYTILEYRCEFEQAPMLVRLAWAGNGELSGLIFSAADEAPQVPSVASIPPPATAYVTTLPPAAPTLVAPPARTPSPVPSTAVAAAAPAPAASAPRTPGGLPEELITTGAPGWPLPGTLLMPTSGGRVPAVIFVHALGPNDRDETIGPNKPLRDLANGLASKGIASLRYDKRTRVFGQRFRTELPNWTIDDEVCNDAVAALALMAARNDVGPIFIAGHDLGAMLAPRIAAAAAQRGVRVAGIVMLAAPSMPFADLIVYQYEFLSFLPIPAATRQSVDEAKARRENVRRLVEQGKPDPKPAPLLLDMPASAWLDIGRYDPATALLDQPALPALLIFGGRDFQVPITEKRVWEARVGSRPNTTLVEFPSVSHLMIDGKGSMSPVEYQKPGHVSQDVIDRISGWIKARS